MFETLSSEGVSFCVLGIKTGRHQRKIRASPSPTVFQRYYTVGAGSLVMSWAVRWPSIVFFLHKIGISHWRITSFMVSYKYKKRAGRTAWPSYFLEIAPVRFAGSGRELFSYFYKISYYLSWFEDMMATINKPNVNIHVSISSVTIYIPPHAGPKPPTATPEGAGCSRYIFYHTSTL